MALIHLAPSCFNGLMKGKYARKDNREKLADAVKARGGLAPKFTSLGFDGMPDRIVLMPGGRMAFVEVKAPGKAPRPLQEARHRLLRQLGFRVYVLDDESPDWRNP